MYLNNSHLDKDLQNDRVEFESYKSESNYALNRSGLRQTQQVYSNQSLNNDPVSVTSLEDLFSIFGVTLSDNLFAFNGQVFELKLPLTQLSGEQPLAEASFQNYFSRPLPNQDGENANTEENEQLTHNLQIQDEFNHNPSKVKGQKIKQGVSNEDSKAIGQDEKIKKLNKRKEESQQSPTGFDASPCHEENYSQNQQTNELEGLQKPHALSINLPNQLLSVSASHSAIHEDPAELDRSKESRRQDNGQGASSYEEVMVELQHQINSSQEEDAEESKEIRIVKKQRNHLQAQNQSHGSLQDDLFSFQRQREHQDSSEEEATIQLKDIENGPLGNMECSSSKVFKYADTSKAQPKVKFSDQFLYQERAQSQQVVENTYNEMGQRPVQPKQRFSMERGGTSAMGSKIIVTDELNEDEEPNTVSNKIYNKRSSTKNLEFVKRNSGKKKLTNRQKQNLGFTMPIESPNSMVQSQQHQNFNLASSYSTKLQRFSNAVSPTANGRYEGALQEEDDQWEQNQELFSINLVNSQGEFSPRQKSIDGDETKRLGLVNIRHSDQSNNNVSTIPKDSLPESLNQQITNQDLNEEQIQLLEQQNLIHARNTLDSRRKSLSDINLLHTLNDYQDDKLYEVNLLKDSALVSPFISKQAIEDKSIGQSLEASPDYHKRIKAQKHAAELGLSVGKILGQSDPMPLSEGATPLKNQEGQQPTYPLIQHQINFLQDSIHQASRRLSSGQKASTLKEAQVQMPIPFNQEESSLQRYMNSQLKSRRDSAKSGNSGRQRLDQMKQSTEKRRKNNKSQDSIEHNKSFGQSSLNNSQSSKYKSASGPLGSPNQVATKPLRKSLGQAQIPTQPQNSKPVNQHKAQKHAKATSDQIFSKDKDPAPGRAQQKGVEQMSYQINLADQVEENAAKQALVTDRNFYEDIGDSVESKDPDESYPILRAVSSKAIMVEEYQALKDSQRQMLNGQLFYQLVLDQEEGELTLPDQQQNPTNTVPIYEELQEMKSNSQSSQKGFNQDFVVTSPKSFNHIPMFDIDQSDSVNVAFMFASPIFFKEMILQNSSEHFNPAANFILLQDSLTQTQNNLKLSYYQATINNLYHLMTQNPEGIHLMGEIYSNHQDQNESFLVLEKESGEAEMLSALILMEILTQSDKPLDFVFALTNSDLQEMGAFLQSADIKHVICAKNDSENQDGDEALQTFILTFYGSLYMSNITVCQAFQSAQSKVQQLYGFDRSRDYLLVTHHHQEKWINNSEGRNLCRRFESYQKGQLELVDEPFFQTSMPVMNGCSDAREKEVTQVISEMILNRLTIIMGYSGLGKSALLHPVLSFVSTRSFFSSGIIYLNLRGVSEPIQFLKLLTLSMMSELPYFEAERIKESIMMNTEQCFKLVLQFLKGMTHPLLFVFDNTEESQINFSKASESMRDSLAGQSTAFEKKWDYSQNKESYVSGNTNGGNYHKFTFERILEEIMSQNPYIKVLLTTQKNLEEGYLQSISKSVYILHGLSPYQVVAQLQKMSRQLTQQEVDELLGYASPQRRVRSQSTAIPNLQNPFSNSLEELESHELIELMCANPQAFKICIALLQNMSLRELFEYFKSNEVEKILISDKIQCMSLAALRLSIELAIRKIKNLDDHQPLLQFFYLICLLGIPVTKKQLRKIWGLDFERHLEDLQSYGLVSMSWEDPSRVVVSSFVAEYGRATVSASDMVLMINELSRYLSKKCEQVYRGNSKYRKSKSKALLKCRELKWKSIGLELAIFRILRTMSQDYSEKIETEYESEHNQISKIQISKVYETQLSRTPSQPSLKKFQTLRSQASSQLVKQKTQTTKARTSFNGIVQKSVAATIKGNKHLKKSSLLQQNYVPNLSSMLKSSNESPAKKSLTTPGVGSKYQSAVGQSRNKHVIKQNSQNDKHAESYLFQEHQDYTSTPIQEELSAADFFSSLYTNYDQLDKREQMHLIEKDSCGFRIKNRAARQMPEEVKFIDVLRDPQIIEDIIKHSDFNSSGQISKTNSPKHSNTIFGFQVQQAYQQNASAKRQQKSSKVQKSTPQRIKSPQVEKAHLIKDDTMHDLERAILRFMMTLFLFREMEQLASFFDTTALSLDGCKIYLANLYRIKGLLFQSQQNTQQCVVYLKKGKELYKYKDSTYGEALSRYSIALFQKKLLVQQNLDDSVVLEHGYDKLVTKFDKALTGFKEVNHLIGQALCHNQLSLIYKTKFTEQKSLTDIEAAKAEFNHHQNEQMRIMQEYQNYPLKKKCPHVKRVQGPEFSLMLELVLELANVNLFPAPLPVQQQKYELQAIQEDEMEESILFSEENNVKDALRDQQEVFSMFLDTDQQQLTPKSRVSRVNQKEIQSLYSQPRIYPNNQDLQFDFGQHIKSNGLLKLQAKQQEDKVILSSSSQKQQTNTILSGSNTIEIFGDHEDYSSNSPSNSFREESQFEKQSLDYGETSNNKLIRSSHNKQQITPDNYALLSDKKPKYSQNELGFQSPFITEEDNRIYTCSPQESSINFIHSTEDIQMNQQAYFSQTARRSMRVQSQLETVEEETEQIYFQRGLDMESPQNPKLHLRTKFKNKTSLDMTDKNKIAGGVSGTGFSLSYVGVPGQVGNLKQRNSLVEPKIPKKLVQTQPPKPSASKNKIIQINIKHLK